MKIIPFLKQKWNETDKLKMFESAISSIIFGVMILSWLEYIFKPIDDYLKTHTFDNTESIVIYVMLGFVLTSIISGLYLIRFLDYFVIKSSLICYKLVKVDEK